MQTKAWQKLSEILSHFKGDAIGLYATRFGAVFLQSVTLFVIAAFVSMEEFGRFSYLFSASRIVSVIIGVGGAPFLLRELSYRDAKEEGGRGELFFSVFVRTIISTAIVVLLYSIVMFGAAWLNDPTVDYLDMFKESESSINMIIVLVTAFFFSTLQIIIAVVRVAKSATFSMFLNDCLPYLIFLILFILLLQLGRVSAEVLMIAFSGALFISCLAALFFSISYLKSHKGKKNNSYNKQYLTFWGGGVIGSLLAQSDVIIAKHFLDDTTLGIYALLRRMSNLISLPQVIVNWSINVDVAREYRLANKQALQGIAIKGLMLAVPVALLMVLGIGSTSLFWLSLFNVELSSVILGVLSILMFGQLINVLSGANLLFADQCREEDFVLKARILSLFIGFVMMPIGASHWGIVGLAISCIIPMVILNIIMTYRVRKVIGVWTSIPVLRLGNKLGV